MDRISAQAASPIGLCLIGSLLLPGSIVLGDAPALSAGGDRPVLVPQVGHTDAVKGLSFSPDGRMILTASLDRTAYLWDLETGRQVRQFLGHTASVHAATFTKDGRRVATASADYTARLWDAATGREQQRFSGHTHWVRCLSFSGDSLRIVTGSFDKTARVWDVGSGAAVRTLKGHTHYVLAVAFSPDDRRILTGGADRTARLWDVTTGEEVRCFRHPAPAGGVSAVAFGPDGDSVFTGCEDGSVFRWDAKSGAQGFMKNDHSGTVRLMSILDDRTTLVTGGEEGTLIWWDSKTGARLRQLAASTNPVTSIEVSRDARSVAMGYEDGTTRTRGMPDGGETRLLRAEVADLGSTAPSADGRLLLTAGRTGTIGLWDLAIGKEVRRTRETDGMFSPLVISRDGCWAAAGYSEGFVRLWEVATGREVQTYRGHTQPVGAVAISADSRLLLTGGNDGTARLWDRASGREIRVFQGNYGPGDHVGLTPEGLKVLRDRRFQGHQGLVTAVAFLPGDSRILTGGTDLSARLWDVNTGKEVQRFLGHESEVIAVAASPDGHLILTGSGDKTARLWEAGSGQTLRPFVGHTDRVSVVAFSGDAKTLLTGSEDGTVRLWDAGTGRELRRFESHNGYGISAAFSAGDRFIVSGSGDGFVRYRDARTGRELFRLIGITGGHWVVTDPAGRFDTNLVESVRGLSWVFADDPFRPLPPELFLRDYFEPRLLPRILDAREGGSPLPSVRPLADLNRVQPVVRITAVRHGDAPETCLVTVEAAQAQGEFQRGAAKVSMRSGVYDVRLFRDGQLVGRWPEPAQGDDTLPEPDPTSKADMVAWQSTNRARPDGRRAVAGPDGRLTITFSVRLPREAGRKVEFTAYAFNEDRVKSATASASYEVPAGVPAARRRAYVVAMGAEAFSDPAWDLRYAAADARLVLGELAGRLGGAGYEVAPVALVSPRGAGRPGEGAATKANLRAVLARLAGGPADPAAAAAVPGYAGLKPAAPDDLVLVFASSHGYTDARGAYYLFPEDIGPPRPGAGAYAVTPDLLARCVSSGELSAWLRGVDAGQLALVVDACHAAATVEAPGFKPGPMGSRGLGQLAYDKGMRVLAASAADDVAIEAEALGQGLLTYALVREGLQRRRAARGGRLMLGGVLTYAAGRVPALYGEVLRGEVKGPSGAPAAGVRVLVVEPAPSGGLAAPSKWPPAVGARGRVVRLGGEGPPPGSTLRRPGAFQTPSLFDYAKDRDVPLDPRG